MQTQLLARVTAAAVVAAGVGAATVPAHAGTTTTAVTTTAQAGTTRVVAHQGQRGDVVRALQSHLNDLGYLRPVPTGSYGTQTRDAVKAYQRAHRLPVTGTYDTRTDAALNASVDADPRRGWVSSVTRTRTGWALTVVKDRVCINGDTSRACRGLHIGAEDFADVPIGKATYPMNPSARVSFLRKGDSNNGPWMSVADAVKRKVLPGHELLVRWTWDGHGHIATIAEDYRP